MIRRIRGRNRQAGPVAWPLLCALLVYGGVVPPFGRADEAPQEVVILAGAIAGWLNEGRAAKVVEQCTPQASAMLPRDRLEDLWRMLTARLGPLRQRTVARTRVGADGTLVVVTCEFEQASMDMHVVFNERRQVAGLWFSPHEAEPESSHAESQPAD